MRLQHLLFIIDRHWDNLLGVLQQEMYLNLVQLLSSDDHVTQSWTLLCLGTIACSSHSKYQASWDSLWTLAMRRTSLPAVCRLAYLVAHTLLERNLVSSRQLIEMELENFVSDISIHGGPSMPYDSVCGFLCAAIRYANTDVRLYGSGLTDATLAWLIETLESCLQTTHASRKSNKLGYFSQSDLFSLLLVLGEMDHLDPPALVISPTIVPPHCFLTSSILDEITHIGIRQYMMDAVLPALPVWSTSDLHAGSHNSSQESHSEALSPPTQKQRKISVCLLRLLDNAMEEQDGKEMALLPLVQARRLLDSAVLALEFQSALVVSGIQVERRLIQVACQVISNVLPALQTNRWSLEEKCCILLGLEPILQCDSLRNVYESNAADSDIMAAPGAASGIARAARLNAPTSSDEGRHLSVALQRYLWSQSEVSFSGF